MSTYVPPSIAHAVEFLTQPLRAVYPPSQIVSHQRKLGTRLSSLFFQQCNKFVLNLLPGRTPPSALYMTCMSLDICWADWMKALGGKPFDLVVEMDRVTARNADGTISLVWSNYPPPMTGERPRDRPSESAPYIAPDMTHAPTRQRTLAQLILASPEEDREADELFASITDAIITGPTSTQPSFSPMTSSITSSCMNYPPCHYVSPKTYKSMDDFSPPVTRPSSRSSAASSNSTFSSVTDDSFTFTSLLNSPGYATRQFEHTQPTFQSNPPSFAQHPLDHQFHHRPFAQNVPHSDAPRRRHVAPPSVAPRPPRFSTSGFASPPAPIQLPAESGIPLDCVSPIDAKFEKTKYLYQGGVSTVLTGGVMLGGSAGGVKTRSPRSSNQNR